MKLIKEHEILVLAKVVCIVYALKEFIGARECERCASLGSVKLEEFDCVFEVPGLILVFEILNMVFQEILVVQPASEIERKTDLEWLSK